MAKVNKNIRNVEGAVRSNIHSINPETINVYWERNERKDYGDVEMTTLMNQIERYGVLEPITVFFDKNGEIVLFHGYRRMKAIQRLKEERGVVVESVQVTTEVENEEREIIMHHVKNSSKQMTDLESGRSYKKLKDAFGYNATQICEVTGFEYQKVTRLLSFVEKASDKLQSKVESGEVAINTAVAFTKIHKTKEAQDAALMELEAKQNNPSNDIDAVETPSNETTGDNEALQLPTDKKVTTPKQRKLKFNEVYTPKNAVISLTDIKQKLSEAKGVDGVDIMLVTKIEMILNAIQEGNDIAELLQTATA